MRHRKPLTELATHDAINQPPPLGDINLYDSDAALRGAVEAGGGVAHHSRLVEFGARCGAAQTREWARQANENPPRLKPFDRYGRRLDEVDFHPAYHRLMELGLASGRPAVVDRAGMPGARHLNFQAIPNDPSVGLIWVCNGPQRG